VQESSEDFSYDGSELDLGGGSMGFEAPESDPGVELMIPDSLECIDHILPELCKLAIY
jgi:hypothetical protein